MIPCSGDYWSSLVVSQLSSTSKSEKPQLQSFNDFIVNVLEPRILPFYRLPYPYKMNNHFAHLTKVNRPNHGCMHICRSLFFLELMCRIYTNILKVDPEKIDLFAMRHAIAFHDVARNGEGVDIWEKESADFAKRDLTYLYGHALDEDYLSYISKLIDKEYCREHLSHDCNQMIVHACDTIEILRVTDIANFDRSRFHFLSPTDDPLAKEALDRGVITLEELNALREQFINEASIWIEETNPYDVKERLEFSKQYFKDLMQIFDDKKEKLSLKLFISELHRGKVLM